LDDKSGILKTEQLTSVSFGFDKNYAVVRMIEGESGQVYAGSPDSIFCQHFD
jgi:hypothetical protein